VPLIQWQERHFVRISIQAYNTQADVDALLDALEALLPQVADN
jgi:selenocysteine lyase/cysteine desulfurase